MQRSWWGRGRRTIIGAVSDLGDRMNRHEWTEIPANRVMGHGHSAGDFLEAYNWEVLDESPGFLRISAPLPDRVLNPRGQLFGGFTGTYVDLVSLFTVRAGPGRVDPEVPRGFITTMNMRIDYYEPVLGPTFEIEGTMIHERGKTKVITVRMIDAGKLAVHALTTLRVLDD